MKRFAEQLRKKSDTVKLRAAERRELRERVVAYMEYHPLPKSAAQQNAERYVQTEPFRLLNFNTFYVRSFMGAFAMLLLIVVPVVAERAVPGDVLYPVKVQFNEEVRSSLAVSPYAKVEWETERLSRRISEARLLASEGKLTAEVEAEVTQAVQDHSDAAQEGIAAIRASDSDEAALAEIALESALTVQSEVLANELEKEAVAAETEPAAPGRSVAALAGAVARAQADARERHSGVSPSYEKLMARVEAQTTRADELFAVIKDPASEAEVTDIERRLADIERKIESATAEGGDASIATLRTALSDIEKLINFMTDIDVRSSVTVDELVPVTLTDEEYQVEITDLHSQIDAELVTLRDRLAARSQDDKTEKIAIGLETARQLASSSKVSFDEAKYAGAKESAEEALLILSETSDLIGFVAVPKDVPEPDTADTPEEQSSTTDQVRADQVFDGEVRGTSTRLQRASSTEREVG
ncbi:DUF5667 domain-containing protein [Candidatus Pacebacteria bacterium]|nr:DUF5667 domain-containing protein [Candidatus Paceibacterota bacterium]